MDLGLLTSLPPASVAAVLATYLAAGAVKGAMGFGLPVVAIAALPFVVPVDTALALNAMVILVSNLQQIRAAARAREGLAAAWPMILGMALMVPLGAAFAAGLPSEALTAALGALVLGFVALNLANPALEIPRHRSREWGFGLGLASGLIGGITTAPGPLFVAYVTALKLERAVFMAALGFIMASFGATVTASFVFAGIVRAEHLALGLLAILPAVGGMMLGNAWASRLPAETFRRAVLGLLGLLALLMIERSLF